LSEWLVQSISKAVRRSKQPLQRQDIYSSALRRITSVQIKREAPAWLPHQLEFIVMEAAITGRPTCFRGCLPGQIRVQRCATFVS